MSEKDLLVKMRHQEIQITLKLLRAFPQDQLNFKPHDVSRSAGDLAYVLAIEDLINKKALDGKIDFSGAPATPGTMPEIITAVEAAYQEVSEALENASEKDLDKTVDFGGRSFRIMDIFWMMLHDQIHHRGQFSVYIRMAGGKVPSIYGPSADDKGEGM